ncbi:MAG: phage holin family protein [Synergistaceae bacterium]|nr:phage holin family protein [Synergistaceae bacterium]
MIDEFSEFIVAGTIGLLGWFFGGMDGFIKVLVTFSVIDYVTGVCAAGVEGKISSSAGFNGIARKVVMFLLVGVSHIIDQHILGHFGHTDAMRTAVCLFYIGNEGISIIENADKLKVPIPGFLRGKFLNFAKKCLEEENPTAILEKKNIEQGRA